MLAYWLNGAGIALSAVAIPGPLTAYLIAVTLQGGWRRGLLVAFMPLLADIPLIIAVVLFLGQLQALVPGLVRGLQVAGGLLLLWIAWGAIRQLRRGDWKPKTGEAGELTTRSVVQRGLLMNILSPGPYIFWTTINGPLLLQALNESPLHGLAFLLGFYGTFIGGLSLWVFAFDRLGKLDERLLRGVMVLTIGVLIFFGLRLIVGA